MEVSHNGGTPRFSSSSFWDDFPWNKPSSYWGYPQPLGIRQRTKAASQMGPAPAVQEGHLPAETPKLTTQGAAHSTDADLPGDLE